MFLILVINPGSTSTKVAVFRDKEPVFTETLRHSTEELSKYKSIIDQFEFRTQAILNMLKEKGISLSEIDAIVGRGGLLKPIESGTYIVNEKNDRGFKEG